MRKIYLHKRFDSVNISSVGSANQDFRSYTLNFEVNSFNYNPALTQELKKINSRIKENF